MIICYKNRKTRGWPTLINADLRWADLRWADLRNADLRNADLRNADLRWADLRNADLRDAHLFEADLRNADLREAKNIPKLVLAETNILPDGDIIGWKSCRSGVIVKLLIKAETKRSNATGRKCRAESVVVLEVIGADKGISYYKSSVEYVVGETVTCDEWCDDRWNECGGGIHFFITREEAESY